MHEHVIDSIVFTGKIFCRLSMEAGYNAIPTKYEHSLIRLKSLGKKLRKDSPTIAK